MIKKKNQPLLEEDRLTDQDKKNIFNQRLFFNQSSDDTDTKLDTFAKYVRRQRLSKFLAHFEIYKKRK